MKNADLWRQAAELPDQDDAHECLCAGVDIVATAMGLHADNQGTADAMPRDERGYQLAVIQCRLHHWRDSLGCPVDDAVKALLRAVEVETQDLDNCTHDSLDALPAFCPDCGAAVEP